MNNDMWARLGRTSTHKTQIRILEALADGKTSSPKRLSEELDESLGNVSHHTKVLVEKGLLKLVRTEPRRGALEHFYEVC